MPARSEDRDGDLLPLIETPEALQACKGLFQELYGVPEPVLPLRRVLHWADVLRQLGRAESSVDRAATCLIGGYFYNVTTPVPTEAELEETLEAGRSRGIRQFLVPTVRNRREAQLLVLHGFRPIPWFIESIFVLRDGVEADLRDQLGRHRQRSIERVADKVEAHYPASYYELADIKADPTVLEIAAELHECNVNKYGHARNFYSVAILRQLCASPLGEHVLICIRRDRATGEAVQVSISLIDRYRRQLYWLVQGIFREGVSEGYNLFVADAYQLFKFAERSGIREINLSRGGQEQKLHLGANRFNLLNNWVLSSAPGADTEISAITAGCRDLLGLGDNQEPMIGKYRLQ